MNMPYVVLPESTTPNHKRVQEILQKIYSYKGQQANNTTYNRILLLLQALNEYVTVVVWDTIYYEDKILLVMLSGESASEYYANGIMLQNIYSRDTMEKYQLKQHDLLMAGLMRSSDVFLVEEVIE